jgi:hypothetical protein
MYKKLSSNEKAKINLEYEKAITLYRCVNDFIKLFELKIDSKLYKNIECDVKAYFDVIDKLKEYKLYVEANVPGEALQQIHIFRTENKVLAKRMNISSDKIYKLKKGIRGKFIPVYLEYKELINRFL